MALPEGDAAATPPGARRDVRLDLLRGACVLLMIFGHLGWRKLEAHFHLGFVTVAEGFFFLSGATLGLVSRRRHEAGRSAELDRRLVGRGLWLWGAHLVTVALARLLAGSRAFPDDYFNRYWGQASEPLRWISFDQPSVLNVLPRYVVFVLAAPAALALLRRGHALLLAAATTALWLATWLSAGALRLPVVEGDRGAYASTAWQLLFFGGLLFGWLVVHADGAERRERDPSITWLAVGAAGCALFVALESGAWAPLSAELLPRLAGRVDLGPLRLLNFAAAAAVVWWAISRFREPVARWTGRLVVPFGQWALPAFLLHIPLVWALLFVPALDRNDPLRHVVAIVAILGLLPLLERPAVQRWLRP